MTESNILINIAKSKATANKLAKSVSADQLEEAIANLQAALDGAKKREQAKEAKRRAANIKKLTAMMADIGLSPKDIAKLADSKPAKTGKSKAKRKAGGPRKGAKVAPKYEIVVDGERLQWTGRGRMPLAFKALVEKSGSLEQCLIQPAAE